MFVALKLSKEGYYQGNPEEILKAPVDIVMQILKYEKQMGDYLNVFQEINRGEN